APEAGVEEEAAVFGGKEASREEDGAESMAVGPSWREGSTVLGTPWGLGNQGVCAVLVAGRSSRSRSESFAARCATAGSVNAACPICSKRAAETSGFISARSFTTVGSSSLLRIASAAFGVRLLYVRARLLRFFSSACWI